MTRLSFQRCNFDYCVYFKTLEDREKIYLLLYINYMLIACKHIKQIDLLKYQLRTDFKIKELGSVKKILSVDLIRNRKKGTFFLTQ